MRCFASGIVLGIVILHAVLHGIAIIARFGVEILFPLLLHDARQSLEKDCQFVLIPKLWGFVNTLRYHNP
jgi:hypothetical protein